MKEGSNSTYINDALDAGMLPVASLPGVSQVNLE